MQSPKGKPADKPSDRPADKPADKQADKPAGSVEGEGSYTAARAYGKSVKKFVESGKVEQASHDARPRDAAEARELEEAEQTGLKRAKEEDPEVSRAYRNPAAGEPRAGKLETHAATDKSKSKT